MTEAAEPNTPPDAQMSTKRPPTKTDARPVLVVSTGLDLATDAVVDALGDSGTPYVRLDTERFPYELTCTVGLARSGVASVDICGRVVSPRAVWYRRLRSPVVPEGMDPGMHEYCVREAAVLMTGVSEVAAGRVMSEPAAIFRAENKVVQLVAATSVGLVVPDTCISNDPERVREFAARHDRIVCKPLRSGWFRDAAGEWSIYTTALDRSDLDEIDSVRLAPSIFQPLIPKACDVRVTVVGRRTFTAEIDSQVDESSRVDWRRTTDPDLPHRRADLPEAIQDRLLALMDRLKLQFGAIDLIRTPNGEYVFLEVNPNGQWLWLDDKLDLGITRAVAAWLTGTDADV